MRCNNKSESPATRPPVSCGGAAGTERAPGNYGQIIGWQSPPTWQLHFYSPPLFFPEPPVGFAGRLIFLLRLLSPRKRRLVACTSRTPARRSPAPLLLRVRRDARPPGAVRRHAPAHAAAPIVAVDDVLQHLLQVLQRVRLLRGASSVRKARSRYGNRAQLRSGLCYHV